MKLSHVIPVLTALIGFGLGCLLMPAVDPAPCPSVTTKAPRKATPAPLPAAIPPNADSRPVAHPEPVGNPAPIQPVTDVAERSQQLSAAKSAAKMQRFAEAIGLEKAQQAELKKVIADNELAYVAKGGEMPPGPQETLQILVSGGTALEKSIAALLTPEQTTAFEALRKRESDNRIEATTQRDLGNLTEITDLSAEQRDKALELLRQSAAAELAAMPSCLALLLDSSVLPLGSQATTAQSIQTLRQFGETPDISDPGARHAKLIENQRRKLDARFNLLKPLFTPAQSAQYQAVMAERFAIQDAMAPPRK
jgi:hypothetical protein